MSHFDYEVLAHLRYRQQPSWYRYNQEVRDQYTKTYQPGSKKGFEAHAFACLFDSMEHLGITELFRCNSARVGGLFKLDGVYGFGATLLEIKTTLNWGTLSAALAAFISGSEILCNECYLTYVECGGLIVFDDFATDWVTGSTDSIESWAKLYRFLFEMQEGFPMAAVQLRPDGFYNPFLDDDVLVGEGRIGRLFRPYRDLASKDKEQPALFTRPVGQHPSLKKHPR